MFTVALLFPRSPLQACNRIFILAFHLNSKHLTLVADTTTELALVFLPELQIHTLRKKYTPFRSISPTHPELDEEITFPEIR